MNRYRYILTCIDVHSRYAAARAMTNRNAPTIKQHLESIFDEMGYPQNINCDQEFSQAAVLRNWLMSKDITLWVSETDQPYKNAIVERFNRTLAELLQRWRTSATGLRHWFKVLPEILYNYNHTRHSTTKETPHNVFTKQRTSKQIPQLLSSKAMSLKVGDMVRVRTQRKTFDKSDALQWSRQTYEVAEQMKEMFRVRNTSTGEVLQKRYKAMQLLPV